MPNNSTKILFLLTLISGILISLCANSWLGAWMGLEINLLSFIPLLSNHKNMLSTEASLKYFLVQAIASSTLLFLIISKTNLNEMFYLTNMNMWNNLMLVPLLMKIACAPFHWWLPSVIEGLTWNNCFIILVIQKMAPMILISYLIDNNNFMTIMILTSAFIGAVGGLNQTSLRKILAFSSINHIGWMLAALISSINVWLNYYMIYMITIITISSLASITNLSYISQTFNSLNKKKLMKISIFVMMLSLGGLPPLLGFFPKWMIIETLMQNSMTLTILMLIMSSLLTLFYYMRIMYTTLLISNSENLWSLMIIPKYKSFKTLMFSLSITILGMLMCTMIILMY